MRLYVPRRDVDFPAQSPFAKTRLADDMFMFLVN